MNNPYELLYMSRMEDAYAFKALFLMYQPLVQTEVKKILLEYPSMREMYEDDLVQEAMCSIPQAIQAYRFDLNCGFTTFLMLVARRRIYSMLRSLSAKSVVQYTDIMRLDATRVNEPSSLYEVLPGRNTWEDPRFTLRFHEAQQRVKHVFSKMSDLDKQVFEVWQTKKGYKEASEVLGMSYKSFDGRVQRIKRQIRAAVYALEEND